MNPHYWFAHLFFQSVGGFFTFITVLVNGYIAYATKRQLNKVHGKDDK